ncbi:MAG: hypothetical protein KJI69_06210 [Patescibacteria group bacterium]|nr:hypothetical protein [Patescibacteria group bacterium]
MVAAFNVNFDFGGADNAPGTEQDITGLGPPELRFKQADNATIDSSDPMPIPTAGTEFSRWKQIYLVCTTAPDTQVDNVRFFTDGGGFGTGITVRVGDQFPLHSAAIETGYDVSDANAVMTTHTDITTSSDAFTFTTGSPLSGPTISEAGGIINAIGETTNYLVLQMEVLSTASPGNLTDETFTFRYDEI